MVDMSVHQHRDEPVAKKARYLSIVEDDASSFSDDDSTASLSDNKSHDKRGDSETKKGTGDTSSQKIEHFLQLASRQLGGLNLSLNDHGCCAFRYDGITIVLDVPTEQGAFCFYTRNLVAEEANPTQDQTLFLNSNGYARNGLLSTKKHEDGSEEVIFSYVDVVNELTPQSFLYIIINLVETAAILRSKLLLLMTLKQRISPAFSSDENAAHTQTFNPIPFHETEIEKVASYETEPKA